MDVLAGVYQDPFTTLNAKKKDSADVLSKREYFALAALQGILASSLMVTDAAADLAVQHADALLLRLAV